MSGKRVVTTLRKGKKAGGIQSEDKIPSIRAFGRKRKNSLDIQNQDEFPPIGAFAVSANGDQPSNMRVEDVEISSKESISIAHSSRDITVKAIEAVVVRNDVVDAFPMEKQSPILQRRVLISIVTLLFIAGSVILIVFLTCKPRVTNDERDVNLLLDRLKSLLTQSSRQELEVPGSVPFQALHWLLNESNFDAYPLDRQIQRFALAIFFFSTQGVSWNIRAGWLTDFDECTWYQSTSDVCVNGTLKQLLLSSNNVDGSLPNDIALLSSLEVLELASNNLMGSIPLEISNISNLSTLDLQHNSFEEFPIRLPHNLQVFLFSNNTIKGTLPVKVLSQLRRLKKLNLSTCELTGEIPSGIEQMTLLETLDLRSNSLIGTIPTEIGFMKSLKELIIIDNQISGEIPSEIGLCNKLRALNFKNNGWRNLPANLPSELGLLTELMFFDISYYNVNGIIPSEIGQCTKLTFLDLGGNTLSGTIPSEIGELVKLTALLLGHNELTGSFPHEIGMLENVKTLDVRNTYVTGTIPDTLCENEVDKMPVIGTSLHLNCSCCKFVAEQF